MLSPFKKKTSLWAHVIYGGLAIAFVLLNAIDTVDTLWTLPGSRAAIAVWTALGDSHVQGMLLSAIVVLLTIQAFHGAHHKRPRRRRVAAKRRPLSDGPPPTRAQPPSTRAA